MNYLYVGCDKPSNPEIGNLYYDNCFKKADVF